MPKSRLVTRQKKKEKPVAPIIERLPPGLIQQWAEEMGHLRTKEEKARFLYDVIKTDEEALKVEYEWRLWARPNQIPPKLTAYGNPWRVFLALAGRGFGKAVCIETPIPTPSGWTLMGDLKVGDQVIDEAGKPCTVTFVSGIQVPEKAYRFTFNDGETIDSCYEHQWMTFDRFDLEALYHSGRQSGEPVRKFPDNWPKWKSNRNRHQKFSGKPLGPEIRLTQQIVDTLTDYKQGKMVPNHCIPNCAPLQLPGACLPIPPYELGFALGKVKENKERFDLPEHIKEAFKFLSLQDLCIPRLYLRASMDQRLDLLKGLMDAAGICYFDGACEFVGSILLHKDVCELITTLGMKPTTARRRRGHRLQQKRVRGNRKYLYRHTKMVLPDPDRLFEIRFMPVMQVFTLPEKARRVHLNGHRALPRHHRLIKDAVEIEPVPMQCIQVDSPNSMYLCGKGMIPTHNTFLGAGYTLEELNGGKVKKVALIGPTAADIRDVMINGPSGIMNLSPPWNKPRYQEGRRRLIWENQGYPTYGAEAFCYSAEEPQRLRGPQHQFAWVDELCAFKYPNEVWNMMSMGLRLPPSPRVIVTTTPRPIELLIDKKYGLLNSKTTAITSGTTFDNVDNLAPEFYDEIIIRYQGTRLGRQELLAEILTDMPGALWHRDNLERFRIRLEQTKDGKVYFSPALPVFLKKVVAIDPAVTSKTGSAHTAICVAAYGEDDHFYILHVESNKEHPDDWTRRAVSLYDEFEADEIIAETNNGGDLVESSIRHVRPFANIRQVKASHGKTARAEPIAAIYKHGKVHHVGSFPSAEDQMCSFNPLENPSGLKDMVDAVVWALSSLIEDASPSGYERPVVGGERTALVNYRRAASILYNGW